MSSVRNLNYQKHQILKHQRPCLSTVRHSRWAFKYKTKRLKEVSPWLRRGKRQSGVKLVNNNLLVWQQAEPASVMRYHPSSYTPLSEPTNTKAEPNKPPTLPYVIL